MKKKLLFMSFFLGLINLIAMDNAIDTVQLPITSKELKALVKKINKKNPKNEKITLTKLISKPKQNLVGFTTDQLQLNEELNRSVSNAKKAFKKYTNNN